ncbi:hypothetical protein [Microvirga subterranea]|uniref:Uncharacterized protein n=1 Tax=Microvirga subterranea TaxID=186651 RepID=A0A370H757_9HYPH|nr:hypothetical protein [Microvirga subterranea]RDI52415.1 hypothetical protein DES45_11540 [Microvirga subterranea]
MALRNDDLRRDWPERIGNARGSVLPGLVFCALARTIARQVI